MWISITINYKSYLPSCFYCIPSFYINILEGKEDLSHGKETRVPFGENGEAARKSSSQRDLQATGEQETQIQEHLLSRNKGWWSFPWPTTESAFLVCKHPLHTLLNAREPQVDKSYHAMWGTLISPLKKRKSQWIVLGGILNSQNEAISSSCLAAAACITVALLLHRSEWCPLFLMIVTDRMRCHTKPEAVLTFPNHKTFIDATLPLTSLYSAVKLLLPTIPPTV